MEDVVAQQKHADPMRTRTGKTRLGPLSMKQLQELLEKSSRPKDRSKIQNRINQLQQRKKPNA
jgi:hypothetical protein